jgi:hypothetical protein
MERSGVPAGGELSLETPIFKLYLATAPLLRPPDEPAKENAKPGGEEKSKEVKGVLVKVKIETISEGGGVVHEDEIRVFRSTYR